MKTEAEQQTKAIVQRETQIETERQRDSLAFEQNVLSFDYMRL